MTAKLVLSGLALATLAACSSGSSGGSGGGGGGLTPGAGYANNTLTISVDGETIDTRAVLLAENVGANTYSNQALDLTVTTTSDPNSYLVTFNGQQYTLAATGAILGPQGQEREFEYDDGTLAFTFVLNFDSDREQLVAGAFSISDTANNTNYVGTGVFGFPTDPAIFNSITSVNNSSTATYEGQGNINVKENDGTLNFYGGFGDAVLTVDLANKNLSGTISNITKPANADPLNQLSTSTSATIQQTAISDAEFTGFITLDNPADFGLSSAGTVTYTGKFYETAGTGIGAYIRGDDADANGTPAVVSGAIVAEQCPAPKGAC